MEVILLERVAKLGQMGETVRVKDGYARNFLLPGGKALRATAANKTRFEGQRAQLETRNLESKNEAAAIAENLNGQVFIIIRQAGETGHLYGSVSPRDIADAITAGGFSANRDQVVLATPIKTIGLHQIPIHLHPEIVATISINVARSTAEARK
jgi:large subunit ribosomal protein L9